MDISLTADEVTKFRRAWRSFVAFGGVRRIAEYIIDDLQRVGQYEFGLTSPAGRHGLPPLAYFEQAERQRIIREVDLRGAAKYALYRIGFYTQPKLDQLIVAEVFGDDYVLYNSVLKS